MATTLHPVFERSPLPPASCRIGLGTGVGRAEPLGDNQRRCLEPFHMAAAPVEA
jgi:hypothetical protein